MNGPPSAPPRLLLWDIDQTLLHTGGAGIDALRAAFRAVFDLPAAEPIELDLAGATDHGIFDEFVARRGGGAPEARRAEFFVCYTAALEANLASNGRGRLMPGVVDLLARLAFPGGPVLGLLTGNIRAGAAAKLRHFGLATHFDLELGAYGDDHADRNRLGPLALERVNRRARPPVMPAETLVIGDTPKDIRCARALGARVLAVATGGFDAAALRACGADLVFDDLGDTGAVLAALGFRPD
jgi:phosphoglycolate phosphatase